MKRTKRVVERLPVPILLLCVILASPTGADDWPQWRGPYLNGSSRAKGLPVEWSLEEGKNIRWARELPGEGGSTPIISGDRVLLTSTDRKNSNLYALCVNRNTGKILWRRTMSRLGRKVHYNKDASPSPVADGQRVFFLFGTGEFIATDYNGNPLWQRDLEEDFGPLSHLYLYAASPLLYWGRLYLSVLRDDTTLHSQVHEKSALPKLDSFLLCIDPVTGKDLWKQVRPSDATGMEGRDSYATAVPYEFGDEASIILIGANYLTAHDPETGKERWRLKYNESETFRQRVVPSPVVVGDLIIASKPRRGPLFAVRPGGLGERFYSDVVWEYDRNTPDVPSVLHYEGRLYFLQDSRKRISCLEPKTGKMLWEGKIGGKGIYHASPTGADGKIYCVNLAGEVVVLEAGDEFKILSRIPMGGKPTLSTIAVAGDELFIRTEEKLYCVGIGGD